MERDRSKVDHDSKATSHEEIEEGLADTESDIDAHIETLRLIPLLFFPVDKPIGAHHRGDLAEDSSGDEEWHKGFVVTSSAEKSLSVRRSSR